METSPQAIREIEFTLVKKGYDPDEVDAFRSDVAEALESAQTHAAQMESRARAAVSRLQEASSQVQALREGTPSGGQAQPSAGDAEVISRTLMLAQRTADSTVAEARNEAEQITKNARDEASTVLENARSTAATLVDDARVEARRAKEDEIARAENEVQALLARRDFLLGDVEQLEQYVQAQRERLREAATTLTDLAERVPGGLGELRRPVLSASAETVPHDGSTGPIPTTTAAAPVSAAAPAPEPAPVAETMPEPVMVRALDLDDDAGEFDDDAGEFDDDDPMSLFNPAPDPAASPTANRASSPAGTPSGGTSRPPFDFAEEDDELWGFDDAPQAPTTVVPQVFEEVTAEVPVIKPGSSDPFRIGGDELR
jgi:DivIVA domain-containing protein